jgi:hypothetical protein
MRRLVSVGAIVFPTAASLAGCYWLASYQDLTSDLGKAEAGADATADGGVDANADGGGDSAAAEGGPFCPPDAGPLVYCMDFDGVDAGALGLETYEAEAGIVDGVFVSPPSALFVALVGPDAGASGAYFVNFPFTPTSARLEFELKSIVLGQWVTTLGVQMYQESAQTSRVVQVLVAPDGGFQVQEFVSSPSGGTPYGHTTFELDGGRPPDAWHHVVLTVTVDDTNQRYFSGLTVDGQVLEANEPLQASWAQGTAQIGVGSTWCRTGGPQFYYDNVRADFGF